MLATTPAVAQSIEDQVFSQLRAQGFEDIRMSRTLLGRVRVVALSDDYRRELVFNLATGEILRDFLTEVDDDDEDASIRLFAPSQGGSGGGGNDDDEGRDDGDDNGCNEGEAGRR